MRKFFPLLIIGIALGIIEASMALYFRPHFALSEAPFTVNLMQMDALSNMQKIIVSIELWKEVFIIILLCSISALAAKSLLQWSGCFIFLFSLSSIFYYFWLYIKAGWPSSFMDWDILFFIPGIWLAPVVVPIIISFIGLIISFIIIKASNSSDRLRISFYHWLPLSLSLLFWLISFLNYDTIEMNKFPLTYSWGFFITGLALAVLNIILLYKDFILRRKRWLFR